MAKQHFNGFRKNCINHLISINFNEQFTLFQLFLNLISIFWHSCVCDAQNVNNVADKRMDHTVWRNYRNGIATLLHYKKDTFLSTKPISMQIRPQILILSFYVNNPQIPN